ncbi:MAG TPA: hypothetical protein PKV16_04625 [Caldisericia bacterium]|nr:hypothetical protein [Caldisericia bacterium]HPF48595.1 hypothetical protein [Caldisericia bacterium]HPI83745.1 hypothetical protein [Caldisericia bacterium]HPQ93050.1 hypothetical protein [Caldisericia bacterium]HRV75117.1 hypothetical protein [Caldisericia bacterium]
MKNDMKKDGLIMGFTFLLVPVVGMFYSWFTFKKNEKALLTTFEREDIKQIKSTLTEASQALLATWHAAWVGLAVAVAGLAVFLGIQVTEETYLSMTLFLFFFIVVAVAYQIWAGVNGFILAKRAAKLFS